MAITLKAGQTILENCTKCRKPATGIINAQGKASFICSSCNHSWGYSMRSNKGSRFSSHDLNRILKKNNLTVATSTK
jgi:hypothetical protein